ncbi:MAG TPA: 5-(carboxyamino)imidazole ribonucleotide mutase [Phycisphaerae bacterium]|nr:5-(carboxyamino)imidazole ribonucleotide mutase [Phycisphaerae bacterium]
MSTESQPLVAVLMGSHSDWETMRHCDALLTEFAVPHECRVLSAHRTPRETAEYVSQLEGRGVEIVIAGAGGAAHLAGTAAAHTLLPVIAVPIESQALKGLDSLLSTVQMPAGVPVATMAIGPAGAKNAALLSIAILSAQRPPLRHKLGEYRDSERRRIIETTL